MPSPPDSVPVEDDEVHLPPLIIAYAQTSIVRGSEITGIAGIGRAVMAARYIMSKRLDPPEANLASSNKADQDGKDDNDAKSMEASDEWVKLDYGKCKWETGVKGLITKWEELYDGTQEEAEEPLEVGRAEVWECPDCKHAI
jgi:hypothetical protein